MKTTFLRAWTVSAALALTAGSLLASQPPADAPTKAPATASEPAKTSDHYTRVVEKEDGTLVLEIAAKTFEAAGVGGGDRAKVHLVGAVHIGDRPYYESLQKLLDRSDLVLFEGVKPPGAGSFDAALDEAGKIKATKSRLNFLLGVVDEERARSGKLPESLQQAADDAGKRWKTMIASSLIDAWGRPFQYTIESISGKLPSDENGEPVQGASPAPSEQRAVITSLGPDGVSQEGKGDDVRVTGKAAVKKKKGEKDPGLQAKMADALGLAFQLDVMDSSKPNWRSSDMSVDQMQAAFEAAGIEGDQLFSMLDGSSIMGKLASMALGLVKSSPTIAAMLKLTMVDLLGSPDAMSMGPAEMKKMMGVILKDRNDVVLKDLRLVLDTEKRKDVAIFYGAGHFADIEAKLEKDFGYALVSEQWLPAISVNPKAAGMSPAQAKQMRESMKKNIASQAAAAEKAEKKANEKKKRGENVQ